MADFSTGLFGCFSDCGGCLYTIFCPCCAMAQNWADSRDQQCTFCHCCAIPEPIWIRDNIRMKLGQTQNHYFGDCCLYFCCFPCAVCQDTRELKHLASQRASNKSRRRKSEDEGEL